jgi:hypothetical protein
VGDRGPETSYKWEKRKEKLELMMIIVLDFLCI